MFYLLPVDFELNRYPALKNNVILCKIDLLFIWFICSITLGNGSMD